MDQGSKVVGVSNKLKKLSGAMTVKGGTQALSVKLKNPQRLLKKLVKFPSLYLIWLQRINDDNHFVQ